VKKLTNKTEIFKSILTVCLSFVVLYPVAWFFGILKPALIIAFTAILIKFLSGTISLCVPIRSAVAWAFIVPIISFLSLLLPITAFPDLILILAVFGIFILIDYKTQGKFEIYSRIILLSIMADCIVWPGAWGVNELFYGALLQALRLDDWVSRGMELVDEILKFCGLEDCKERNKT
jgi:hypothetical protein